MRDIKSCAICKEGAPASSLRRVTWKGPSGRIYTWDLHGDWMCRAVRPGRAAEDWDS